MTSLKPPAISVIMATQVRNVGYFREAVNSILSQTEPDFELVLIFDGCSETAVEEALSGFDDPRIRAIRSAKNRGLARALNLAVRLARAPLVARMDDDDRCLPDRFQRQREEMDRRGCDVLGAKAFVIDGEGRRVEGTMLEANPDRAMNPFGAVFGNLFIHPAVIMRREWAAQNRYHRRWGRGQDRELWVRAAPTSVYGHLETPVLEYRRQSTTKSAQMDNVRNAYRLIWKFRRRFGIHVPALLAANGVRHLVYILRIARAMIGSKLKALLLKLQPILLFPLCFVMDRRYLTGRHFDGQLTGMIWAWQTVWRRNILRVARPQRVPMSISCHISKISNLHFHPDDLNNLQAPNLYVQNYRASVTIGYGTYIGPNVGLITANHDPDDLDQHQPAQPIILGEKCWIGMNSVIMPGVSLGPRIIVGAGSIVTKSFPTGNCVIAGAPARIIRGLEPNDVHNV